MPVLSPKLEQILNLSVNDQLTDRAIRHAVYLQRYSSGEASKMLAYLDGKLFPQLVSQVEKKLGPIASIDPSNLTGSRRRLLEMSKANAELIRSGYSEMGTKFTKNMKDFAVSEAEWQKAMLDRKIPQSLNVDLNTPSMRTVHAVVSNKPILGKYNKDWFASMARSTAGNVDSQIKLGLVAGESVDQIVRRLKGTKAQNYKDGILEISRRHATTHVRNAVAHTSNYSREETYKENKDVISGVKWVSTLDARTSDICISLDGKVFEVDKGQRPPAHHQCRSTTVPITKSWKELGFKFKDVPAKTRASMNGQVPADLTYGKWLKQQKDSFQNDVLGKGKAEIFRRGKLTVDRFVNQRGRSLTLAELIKLEKRVGDAPLPQPKVKPVPKSKPSGPISGKETRKRIEELTKEVEVSTGNALKAEIDTLNTRQQSLLKELKADKKLQRVETDFKNNNIDFSQYRELKNQIVGNRIVEIEESTTKILDLRRVGREQTIKLKENVFRELSFDKSGTLPKGRVKSYSSSNPRYKGIKKKIETAEDFLSSIVKPEYIDDLSLDFQFKNERAYQRRDGKNLSTIVVRKNESVKVVLHEMAHAVEQNNPKVLNGSLKFYDKRTKGEHTLSLNTAKRTKGYGAEERTRKDKFLDAYMGKDYNRTATELVSMGVEYMYNDPIAFARRDPEMFDWILDLLRGNI